MCKKKLLYLLLDEDEKIKTPDEYAVRLRCQRNSLHTKYIIGISIAIVVWTIATGHATDDAFTAQLSFASTVTSIILSVIAIIFSISGNAQMEMIQTKMEKTVKDLNEASEAIRVASDDTAQRIADLKSTVDILMTKVEGMPKAVAETIYSQNKVEPEAYNQEEQTKAGWINKNEDK